MAKTTLLIFVIALLFSCNQTPKTPETETVNALRKYEYADAIGKRLIIENSSSRGGQQYTDPDGNVYTYVIFWTRISNETEKPVALEIGFPVTRYEIPGLPNNNYQILVPPDTMTVDKERSYDYGFSGLKSFLDNNIHKPSLIKRTINPKESTGFYAFILSQWPEDAPHFVLRTGLHLDGENLFYQVSRYDHTPAHSLMDEKKIRCGSISLKNLTLIK